MRGFKIFYRNQQVVLIGSETGIECGTVTFQDNDQLVGLLIQFPEDTSKKPVGVGFTLYRNNSYIETEIIGCQITTEFSLEWPLANTLNVNNASNFRITKVKFSRWGENDSDLAGLWLTNKAG